MPMLTYREAKSLMFGRVYLYFHTLCLREAKALKRLNVYTGLSEPSLPADMKSTKILCANPWYLLVASDFQSAL